MEQLTSTFLPVVFAELYRLLAEEKTYQELIEDKLAEIGLPLQWLTEAATAYDRKWRADLTYLSPESLSDYALSDQHSHLATWLLSALFSRGDYSELNTRLASAVTARAFDEIDSIPAPLPPQLSPVIISWALGTINSPAGRDHPAIPVVLPSDDNVRTAFTGMIEHVQLLQTMALPWPEMMQTAMYWRGYGLAEALRPQAASGGVALQQLRREAGGTLRLINPRLGTHLDAFGARRNALSHIADSDGRPRFIDVVEDERQQSTVELTMRAMTRFVFHEVTNEVRERRPRAVRPNCWQHLEQELQSWE